jgi:superfamily II DNA/RNA helicase
MDQFQRTETLEKFKANEIQLLVCSDVAARGLDIAAVSHVFNFDVPTHAEDYVHRIGRTGRAGRSGKAYTLAAPEDSKYIAGIERLAGKEIPRVEIEAFAGAALKEETAKSRRGKKSEKAPGEKTEKKARKQEEKPARKDKQGKRGDRRNRDGIGDVPDYGDVPFGETDLVPAFLKRSATL